MALEPLRKETFLEGREGEGGVRVIFWLKTIAPALELELPKKSALEFCFRLRNSN